MGCALLRPSAGGCWCCSRSGTSHCRFVIAVEFVAVALFVAMIIAALVAPLVNILHNVLPRGLAVAVGLVVVVAAIVGVFVFIGTQVAEQWEGLTIQFRQGIDEILVWLENAPCI